MQDGIRQVASGTYHMSIAHRGQIGKIEKSPKKPAKIVVLLEKLTSIQFYRYKEKEFPDPIGASANLRAERCPPFKRLWEKMGTMYF